jgi:alkaline phosphatase D
MPTSNIRSLILVATMAAAACVESPGPQGMTPAPASAMPSATAAATRSGEVSRIAFGSCSDEDRPQPLWPHVVADDPDVWVWLGDNIYGDTSDMAVMRQKYARQKSHPGYQALLGTAAVIGTWDDHDYGLNDGGREFRARRESQQALLDFFGVPAASPRRARAGVYESYVYGAPGRQVKVILLDTRYHRDPIGSGGDVLGDEQWAWLERELRNSRAQVHLIGSSIQVVPQDHRFEKWANFPAARERLFRLIGETRAPGVVFITGDRHIAEISRLQGSAAGYPMYDITSSGLTHTWAEDRPEQNRHRIGEKLVALNYGVLDIDWGTRTLRFTIRDDQRQTRLEQVIPLAELRAR